MLSIIIPCFNEEEVIEISMDKISKFITNKNLDAEVIMVNNASTDSTLDTLNNFVSGNKTVILNQPKKGKGNAIKMGLENAKYNKILILDADLSTDINELKLDWLDLDETVLFGSRYFGNEINTPKVRKFSGSILNFIIRLFFKIQIRDTQCGFKFISTNRKDEIVNKLTVAGFLYDLDLALASMELGMSIKEVPIKYIFDANSSVSMLRDSFLMIIDLVKLKIKYN
jgi:dolichyl-phosphate beta-glucosyltransferase